MAYENPTIIGYTLTAATVSTAATLLTVQGPSGKIGRLVDISAVLTTGVTTAATELRVGDAGDADQYGILSLPVASAGVGYNGATVYQTDTNFIPADTNVIIATDGAGDAGAADIVVTIAWF